MAGLSRFLAAFALLAGCTAGDVAPQPGADARPAQVVLYEDTVTVEMTDRAFCTGPRDGSGRAWSGTLQGCPHRWPYAARLPDFRVARLPLAPGGGGAGRVELTSPAGPAVFSGPR